jgi:hypothetical protein
MDEFTGCALITNIPTTFELHINTAKNTTMPMVSQSQDFVLNLVFNLNK